jgi:group I intron endonuclease
MINRYNCGIYKITNLVNGKVYIGQSMELDIREGKHFGALRKNKHKNRYLQRAFNKYGEENFIFEILLYCEEFELTYYEQELVNRLRPEDYNINRECVDSSKGVKRPPETGLKISKALKGKKREPATEEAKQNMSVAQRKRNETFVPKPWTEEDRQKKSDQMKGDKNPMFGKHRSKETKEKLRNANLGKKRTEESKAKQSERMMGIKRSEESKLKESQTVNERLNKKREEVGGILTWENTYSEESILNRRIKIEESRQKRERDEKESQVIKSEQRKIKRINRVTTVLPNNKRKNKMERLSEEQVLSIIEDYKNIEK